MLEIQETPTICHLQSNQLNILLDGIKKHDESLCEHCIDEGEFLIMKEKAGDKFWYMFDTGKCNKCGDINDVIYFPLWKLLSASFFLTPDSNVIMSWYEKFPRLRIGAIISLIGLIGSIVSFSKVKFNLMFLGVGVAGLSPKYQEAMKMIFNPENKVMPTWYEYSIEGILFLASFGFIAMALYNIHNERKSQLRS